MTAELVNYIFAYQFLLKPLETFQKRDLDYARSKYDPVSGSTAIVSPCFINNGTAI